MSISPSYVGVRGVVQRMVESSRLVHTILTLVILNAVSLGVEAAGWVPAPWQETWALLDHTVLGVFVVEIALKLFVYRLRFFTHAWHVFDLSVVLVALLPIAPGFSALRALRVVRVLRLVSFIPQFRIITSAFVKSMPGVGAVAALLLLIFYVCSIISHGLFSSTFPENFGTLGTAMFTLFQLMTMEGWNEIVRPMIHVHPWAWAFLIPYMIVTTFVFLNMIVGIIVSVMEEEGHNKVVKKEEEILKEIKALRQEIAGMKKK